MDIIKSVIYGITQGITEFLPISSSGHLVILHEYLPVGFKDDLLFDVVLHLATILAVIYYFRESIINIIKAWFAGFTGKINNDTRLAWLIILATIPAALAGYLAGDYIEKIRSVKVVAIMLIAVGILILLTEKYSGKKNELDSINWKNALFIGLTQAISLIPGTSRSGITIIAGMANNLKREAAIKFSFLISVPIILGANIKKIPDLNSSGIYLYGYILLSAGFLAALISGVVVIKYFLKFSRKKSLNGFAIYRFLLAVIVLIIFIF